MRRLFWIVLGAAVALPVGLRGRGQTVPVHADVQAKEKQPAEPAVKPAPPTPIAVKKAELGDNNTWDPEWDKIVEEALPPELLSSRLQRQVKSLCPRFEKMNVTDRRAFWAYFFQALAGAEAGLKPTADVRHADPEVAVVDPVTHRITRQEGLLQLKYFDSERYGCDFDWKTDKQLPEHDPQKTILQPKNNLECGIRILDNQLTVQHKPVLSETSYWVTLRPRTASFDIFKKQLANLPLACGASPYRRPIAPGAISASPTEAKNQLKDRVTAAGAAGH